MNIRIVYVKVMLLISWLFILVVSMDSNGGERAINDLKYPSVAQSGSAFRLGRKGRTFESYHSDQLGSNRQRRLLTARADVTMSKETPGQLVSEGRNKRPGFINNLWGVAKSGKALDFDSRKITLRRFESCHPSHSPYRDILLGNACNFDSLICKFSHWGYIEDGPVV